jgi:hypothetical protein
MKLNGAIHLLEEYKFSVPTDHSPAIDILASRPCKEIVYSSLVKVQIEGILNPSLNLMHDMVRLARYMSERKKNHWVTHFLCTDEGFIIGSKDSDLYVFTPWENVFSYYSEPYAGAVALDRYF